MDDIRRAGKEEKKSVHTRLFSFRAGKWRRSTRLYFLWFPTGKSYASMDVSILSGRSGKGVSVPHPGVPPRPESPALMRPTRRPPCGVSCSGGGLSASRRGWRSGLGGAGPGARAGPSCALWAVRPAHT